MKSEELEMKNGKVFGLLLVLAIGLILIAPASATFVSFNDTVGPSSGSAANVTHYSGYLGGGGGFETPSGLLKDFGTGLFTGVTATLEASNVAGSLGGMPNMGTDAYNLFNGIVNLAESASYNSSGSDWYYRVTFTGLDPTKLYKFLTTANRNSSSYDGTGGSSRWTEFSIIGADTYSNVSSAGVVQITEDVLKMNTGYNTVNGYLVGWEGITAADGTFTILTQNVGVDGPGEAIKSYGMQAFMLEEYEGGEIPEPTTVCLIGAGVAAMAAKRKRFLV